MRLNHQIKFAKIFSVCMFIWQYHTIPPNLNQPIVLKTSFGAKLPNLMTTNISGYMVAGILHIGKICSYSHIA